MVAPTIKGTTTEQVDPGSNGNDLTIATPSGAAAGDLYAFFEQIGLVGGAAADNTSTPATTLVNTVTVTDGVGGTNETAIYLRARDGSEGGSFTFDYSSGLNHQYWTLGGMVIQDSNGVVNDQDTASGATAVANFAAPEITTTVDECGIFLLVASQAFAVGSAPSGWSEIASFDGGFVKVFYKEQTTAGATGTPTIAFGGGSSRWSANIMALEPAGVAPDAVDDLAGTAGDEEVTLTWSAPDGTPTDYDVQFALTELTGAPPAVVGYFSPPQLATSGGNTNPAIPQPDPRVGDLLIAKIAIRPSTVTLATPSGWTEQLNQTATDGGAEGSDTGSVRHYIFTKVADGTEGVANQTWTKTGTASVWIGVISQARSATGTYDIAASSVQVSGDTTTWSGAIGDIGIEADDLVIMTAAQNGDLANASAQDITQAGITAKSTVREHAEYTSTTGNDIELDLAVCDIQTGATTGAATASVTMSAACSGVLGVLRVRQGSGTPRSDVWVRSAGAQVSATTTAVIPYPEHRPTDRLVAIICSRNDTNVPTTPANWNLLGSWTGGQGTFGVDAGNARTTIFWRDVDTQLTGTQSFSITSGSTGVGQMLAVAKPSDASWLDPTGTGAGVAKEDPWSEALTDSIEFLDDAVVVLGFSINTDAMTAVQTPTLSATGVTFGDHTISAWWETTTGNDAALAVSTARVVTGATATPTAGIDFTGTAPTDGPAGSIGLIQLAVEPTWQDFSDGVSATPGATVTGLTNGTAYRFRVRGSNAGGDGPWSNIAGPYTPTASGVTLVVGDVRSSTTVGAVALTQAHTLAVADASSPTTVGAVALTQAHDLAVADASSPTTIGAVALSQDHVLVVADPSSPSTIAAVILTQAHLLAVQDASSPTTIAAILLTQAHDLDVDDASSGTTIDAVVIVQSQLLDVADASSPTTIGGVTVTQAHVLDVDDAVSPTTIATVGLTQLHLLVVADASSPTTIAGVTLAQLHQLAVADASSNTTIDDVVLVADDALIVADASSPTTIAGVTLSQAHLLAVADATSPTTIGAVVLIADVTLVIADASSPTTVGAVVLTQAHTLDVDDSSASTTIDGIELGVLGQLIVAGASSATSIDAVTLFQAHDLDVADASSGTTIDPVTLGVLVVLVVADASSPTTIASVALDQQHLLAVADAGSATTIDPVALTQAHQLVVADASSPTTIDNVGIVQAHSLVVSDASSATTIGSLLLTQSHILAVLDASAQTTIDSIVLATGGDVILSVADATSGTTIASVVLTGPSITLDAIAVAIRRVSAAVTVTAPGVRVRVGGATASVAVS